ncbi:hypothetical protein PCH_Pc17g00850 [Penicillium rubens Wisconsin 54-1255]|uniref:Uncharacterized protein n=1 Tax=Penicillium rubens (strain ATCC 28089 / DSM 1075 / NRRL 1951 / Wisconsin 54-1255) TaxID=500485 RepID=B6HB05_PENRW|nr:hypothetical protein PCH_Pc17g00850 [Penicillium rubens Wisconsin 54-1255]
MVFVDSASAWIGNACIRTNRVHHNTFDSPHDAASYMPEDFASPSPCRRTCANSLIVYGVLERHQMSSEDNEDHASDTSSLRHLKGERGRGARYESSGDSSSIVVMWKGQRACDSCPPVVRSESASIDLGRAVVAYLFMGIPNHHPCHVAFKLIAIGCHLKSRAGELHNSVKAVGTRAEDAMEHARRPATLV